MTLWLPRIEDRAGPIYQRIADAITDAVRQGELAPGTRLPPQRDLAWKLKVTVGTVGRAYMLAEQSGLLSGEVGRGTFVKPPAAKSFYRPPSDGILDLSINTALSPRHGAMLERALGEIAAQDGIEQLLRYMTWQWQTPHLEAARDFLSEVGIDTVPARIVLTHGAHQGLAAAMAGLLAPGESALAEPLTYPGIIDNARIFGHPLRPVEMDDEGMRPDALDQAAAESGARVVFLQPTIHNPTALTMSEQRRRDIVAVAEKRDLLLVEDDVYGALPARRPPPIAMMAPQRTVYVSSASKSIAPGLRVGWMVAPERFVPVLATSRSALTGPLPGLAFEVARRWIEDGTARELMQILRVETAERQRLASQILAGLDFQSDPAAFHVLLRVPEPWRREDFVASSLARGIRIVPASSFMVGQGTTPHAVRISIGAAPDRPALERALVTLRDLVLAKKAAACREVV